MVIPLRIKYMELMVFAGFSQNQLTLWKYPTMSKVALSSQQVQHGTTRTTALLVRFVA